eukprot:gnl/MRDRNA2_/MRDRNA2_130286_c0_seq1.p1 gnl/MRDRNA2_/MRDRNA2_130286_c0~~gnl/MRDRNA2_/MRDRNA2_130286_c0_seq1.p1  ORF type:complete len:246 (-),score=43.63 gnl/MRDRNA2_/MRDRNA2_130286_c0_seq1:64-801(-)
MPFFSFGRKKAAAKPAATPSAPAPPSTHVTITLYCPASINAAEDTWQVEVRRDATIADLKAQVAELYEVPVELQEICRDVDSHPLPDTDPVACENYDVLHLRVQQPQLFGGSIDGMMNAAQGLFSNLMGMAQEAQEMDAALQQSLADVTYNLVVVLPGRSGQVEKRCTMPLSAVALISEVTEAARLELNIPSDQPFQLTYLGQALPHWVTIHGAGLTDGDTILAHISDVSDASRHGQPAHDVVHL